MDMTLGEIILWVAIGLVAGTLAGMIVNGKKEGFGFVNNLIFGLIGAFLGKVIFEKAGINLGLGSVTVSYDLVVAAFGGALLVVFGAKFIEGRRKAGENG